MPEYFNDSPISEPSEDRFAVDPFARALARSIREITSPIGATIALNGPWGVGKSSAVNLIRHHLNSNGDDPIVVDFRCWWFRGEEALTLAFLQALSSALERGLGERAKKLLGTLGANLLQAGPVIGPALNLATGGALTGISAVLTGSLDFSKRFFSETTSVESAFDQLSRLLADQRKRFVVIIDDIDRLSSEEAVMVFRLLKSVGRLPNVIYLVVFDRSLAENAVARRYPTEGPHFLEKIIQASFEVPLPARDELNNAFLNEFAARCGTPVDREATLHLMNAFYDVVAPRLNSPRDLARLTTSIAVSWPPVASEVDLGDFLALEAIRVFEGSLFSAIRSSKARLCGVQSDYGRRSEDREETINLLLAKVAEDRRVDAKTALMRLFPRLEDVGYGSGFVETWEARRRVCTERHFDTYFRMFVGDDTLSASQLNDLIENSGDAEYVKAALKNAVTAIRRSGISKAPLLLDELNIHAERIEKARFVALISAIFEVADEIDREGDQEGGFSIGDNQLRIHWLIRKLTFERCSIEGRTDIFRAACETAQVGWLVDFACSAWRDYHPREGRQPEPPEKCLVAEEYLSDLMALALRKIAEAADTNLIQHRRLAYLLFRWKDLDKDEGRVVRAWTNAKCENDESAAILAKAFTKVSWSQGMGMFGLGDRVAMRNVSASLDGLEEVVDVDNFLLRVREAASNEALGEPYHGFVTTYLEALESV